MRFGARSDLMKRSEDDGESTPLVGNEAEGLTLWPLVLLSSLSRCRSDEAVPPLAKKAAAAAAAASVGLGGLSVLALVALAAWGPASLLFLNAAASESKSSLGRVCLVHVAVGEAWLHISEVTVGSKRAYAAKHGYSMLEYVFADSASLPQCCAASSTFACSLDHVAMKYCPLQDALLLGGAGAAKKTTATTASAEDDVVDGAPSCDYVFLTDSDAAIAPDAPPLDTFASLDGGDGSGSPLVADVVISAGLSAGRSAAHFLVTDVAEIAVWFNSGAMLWRNSPGGLALVQAVLDHDDDAYDGMGSCGAENAIGYGDQWAFCGAVHTHAAWLGDDVTILACPAPATFQNVVFPAESGLALASPHANLHEAAWPPPDDVESFVINCTGDDPLLCTQLLTAQLAITGQR